MLNKSDTLSAFHRQVEMLRRVEIFAHLTDDEIADIARRVVVKRWQGGAIIVGQNELDSGLYVLFSGRAKVVLFGDNGREMILSLLGPGDFFGEMSLIDNKPRSANVVAAEDAVLLVLDRESFTEHLNRHPTTAMRLLRTLASRLRQSDEVIANLALHDVTSRLQRTLVAMAHESGHQHEDGLMIENRPTQQDLANMVGTCRETVSRALSAMARRGLLVSRGRTLILRQALLENGIRAA